jgi:hypothetical protein
MGRKENREPNQAGPHRICGQSENDLSIFYSIAIIGLVLLRTLSATVGERLTIGKDAMRPAPPEMPSFTTS